MCAVRALLIWPASDVCPDQTLLHQPLGRVVRDARTADLPVLQRVHPFTP